MKRSQLEFPAPVTTGCYRAVADDDGNLVPCPRPVAVSGWVRQNNVWNYVDACPGHSYGLMESAG